MTSGKDWQREFRDSLQTHSNQIEKLLEGLREEKDNRSAAQRDFDARLQGLQREVYKNASRVGLIIGTIVVIATAIAQFLLPKLFGP